VTRGEHKKGEPSSDQRGTPWAALQRPAAARPRCARASWRVRTVGSRRVTDERGLTTSGSGGGGQRGVCGAWADPGKKRGGPKPG
jgi:hypothetical protein